ncbi:MAG: DUF4097 family beta strand repeat-containing protein [Acidimicrobiia bacterium]
MTSIAPTPDLKPGTEGKSAARSRYWLWAAGALVISIGALILASWLVPTSTATQSEALDGPIDRLEIVVTGGVSLVAGEQTKLTISKQWQLTGQPTVTVTNEDGAARVTGGCAFYQIRCTTAVTGSVAPDATIVVRTSAGSIDVSGVSAGVNLETSAGSVSTHEVAGQAWLRSSAGDIIGEISDGDVDAETSAGRIELTLLGDFSSLSAITSLGAIELTVPDDVYDVGADTSAGSVTIDVRTDPAATRRIVAESSSGSIRVAAAG